MSSTSIPALSAGVASAATFSLREVQKVALSSLFRDDSSDGSAVPPSAGDSSVPSLAWSDDWRVLVYDTVGRGIINACANVRDLTAFGVSVHTHIDDPRDHLPDIDAVYLVAPTLHNVRTIVADVSSGKYRQVSVNFLSYSAGRALTLAAVSSPSHAHTYATVSAIVEALARGCVAAGVVPRVATVMERRLSFHSLGRDLFHVDIPNAFSAYASARVGEEDLNAFTAAHADALLAVYTTLRATPVVYATPGGPSEMIARALHGRLRSLAPLSATPSVCGSNPLLLLCDRHTDLTSALAHAQTYVALIQETVGPFRGNKITIPDDAAAEPTPASWLTLGGSSAGASGAGTVVALDDDTDAFFAAHGVDSFPAAIEAHEAELASTVTREQALRTHVADDATSAASAPAAAPLSNAIDAVPALLASKKRVQRHSQVMASVMSHVGSRSLPRFVDLEAPTLDGGSSGMDAAVVREVVRGQALGTKFDRLRLAVMHILSCPPAAVETEAAAMLDCVRASLGEDGTSADGKPATADAAHWLEYATHTLAYVRRMRTIPGGAMGSSAAAATVGSRFLSSLSAVSSQLLTRAAAHVQRLVNTDAHMYVTRVAAAATRAPVAGGPLESFLVCDPSSPHPHPYGTGGGSTAAPTPTFTHVCVFVTGGLSYTEYADVIAWARRCTPPVRVMCGGSSMLHPEDMLAQIHACGADSATAGGS